MIKKKFSRMLTLILCMIFVLSACGNQEKPEASQTDGNTATEGKETVASESNTAADEENQTADSATNVDWEDMAEIELYFYCFVPPKDTTHVEDAINAITEPQINTHVNITVLDISSYIQQIGIMMSGGERIDLMMTGFASASYSAMMAQKQLMDISGYLEDYGPNITATIGDMIKATTIGDAVYGVPVYRNVVSSNYIYMRADVLEDLGLTEKARNMTSFDEYAEILQAVKDSEKWNYLNLNLYQEGAGPLQPSASASGKFSDTDAFDQLGDTLGIVRVDENGKVSLNMDSDAYKASAAMIRDWSNAGYVYYDLGGTGGSCEDYMKNDALFSFISPAEFGAENMKSAAAGMPVVAVEIYKGQVSAEACTKFSYCVPTTAKEPEAAIAFLNLAYTNPEINNLLAWGVEGVDYEVVDGVAQYIPGNEEPLYHLFDYSVPNQFLVYPWSGDTADFRQRSEENLKSAEVSKYLGFTCDLSDLVNESAAVSNVIEEYRNQIGSGQASEATLNEFIDKLYSVNVQALIDEYQKQLDAWLAEQ